ncbi:hypothetical protein B7P43_G11995 [Cryptotermes secundus]|uniref:KASH5-like coiled-coil domain-containing protein n=4 Tax=Cryptotermes secundus TaxID=105785 RepID=A0A2J7RA39_9NEOP|nr:uncharacterized protein LOC111862452 isoform X3 [Cryptotermes secundus]XP_023703628.1 uncharacterized protein LOC111862452 isoform X3 [Cryptotermes secundus]XP_023703629.1 uncharacterized protein LOC111862452 isoform X3 [Cryptotermes secundus]PNF37684.1 hypothetical protein B7P43_G11995 [Cryptotermes secundus]PNF37686.1 hypothetical protein B7P43_G11995 [Cryptotermes secundus]
MAGKEEQHMWESEDEPDITEEKVVAMIFAECDTEGTGKVPVLKLMHFMFIKADQNLDRSVLEDLRVMLDPQESNVEVTKQTFAATMRTWAEKLRNKSEILCVNDPDSCHDRNIGCAQVSYDGQASPSSDSSQFLSCDHHGSSFSCGNSDTGTMPVTSEMNSLAECVMELRHTNKRLEEQNRDLQAQVHTTEDSYSLLQKDYKNIHHKVSSLQATMESYHQLQKECEELKEAAAFAETSSSILKLRVQQLEKEAQVHKQQLLELENQKMELILEIEGGKKKNEEMQKTAIVQKMEIEQLLKQCSQHELLSCQQSDQILELEDRVKDLLNNIQLLQEEKQSHMVSLSNMGDELLLVHNQSSCNVTSTGCLGVDGSNTKIEDDVYYSAHSSLFGFDNRNSLLAEFEAVKEYQETLHEFMSLDEQKQQHRVTSSSSTSSVPCGLQNSLPWDKFVSSPSTTNVADREVQVTWPLEFRNQESQTLPNSTGDMRQQVQSFIKQTDPDNFMIIDEELCHEKQHMTTSVSNFEECSVPSSDFVQIELQISTVFHPNTELVRWVHDTDALISVRRETNLPGRLSGACDAMELEPLEPAGADVISTVCPVLNRTTSVTSAPEEQLATSMRRCVSETHVVGSGNSGSSVSSEASTSSSPAQDAFPSLSNGVLQQLGLDPAVTSDILSEQDIENRFSALSLAFKTDKLTLVTRHNRQQRQRDQAERNMSTEVIALKAAVHNLNYLCKDSESIEILGKIQDQVDVLQQSTELVSSSAEMFGAVQQEIRVSKAIEVMLTHVENLKRMYEKEHTELEETKRVLLENNLLVEGSVDSTEATQRNPRHRILNSLSGQGKQRRRASIAVFRPLGSPDSTKTSNASLTFGDTKRGVPHSRRTPSSYTESPGPGWDRTDRLDRPELVGGSMDDIKELSEGRCESPVDSKEPSTTLEENNNCTGTTSHKSSSCDSPPEVVGENVTSSFGNTDKNPTQSGEMNKDFTKDSDYSAASLSRNLQSLRSFRDTAMEFTSQVHMTLVNCMMPLNMDYMLIQTRRCATLLLLFAAFWSLISTFVPTTAESRNSIPFSWLTLKDVLLPYMQLQHYGRPPT